MTHRLSRRTFLAGAGATALGLTALAGCGDDEDGGNGGPGAAEGPRPATGAFPTTIAHKYGSTTVESAPARVACWGGSDVDMLLALGITPVLIPQIVTRWKTGVGPWAQDKLGAERPIVVGGDGEVDFERIAAARPDVITLVESDVDESGWAKLNQLAPTIAPPKGFENYLVPWPELGRQVGAAVGKLGEAEALVTATEAKFTAARKANPQFAGKTAILVDPATDGGVYTFAANDVRTRFLRDLGFGQPSAISGRFGNEFYIQISAERLDLLDEADLLVVASTSEEATAKLNATPTYGRLKAVREQRVVTIDDPDLADAFTYSTVLSIPFQLERFVPKLAAALEA